MTLKTTVAVVGLGYVGCRSPSSSARHIRPSDSIFRATKVEAYRKFVDPTGEVSTAELRPRTACASPRTPPLLRDGGFHRRRRADADRRGAPTRLRPAARRERSQSAAT